MTAVTQTSEKKTTPMPPAGNEGEVVDAEYETVRAFATLPALMRESPPVDGEYVYKLTALHTIAVGQHPKAIWPAEPVYVKGKKPSEARDALIEVERIGLKDLHKAAVEALRAKE